MTRILLAVLALPVELELSGTAGPSPRDASAVPPEDSDIVGMPTGWATDDGRQVMAVGDRWYLELVPTSRN